MAKKVKLRKTTKKPLKKATLKKPSLRSRAVKAVHMEAIDRRLLKMAAQPYAKILKQIETSKKRLDEERRLALNLGSRILTKAKEVRDSLLNVAKSRRS